MEQQKSYETFKQDTLRAFSLIGKLYREADPEKNQYRIATYVLACILLNSAETPQQFSDLYEKIRSN